MLAYSTTRKIDSNIKQLFIINLYSMWNAAIFPESNFYLQSVVNHEPASFPILLSINNKRRILVIINISDHHIRIIKHINQNVLRALLPAYVTRALSAKILIYIVFYNLLYEF